ncbi:hypothetical protein LPY66_03835 [Dehalobacter sp. DCM]|uniref:hypothetical protein n=1 Tax=Dehalobacter sp. DCM TaxID=2907827 RepID=UPI0030816FB4|nr:hypothetical protein LPY66_03835 [Dehalobacter sp. DCM]
MVGGFFCVNKVLNNFEYHKKLTDTKYGEMASNLFFPKIKTDTREGKFIGYIITQINLGLTGVIISYLLSATGRDKAVIKGVGVTTSAWLFYYGVASRLSTKQ